MTYKENLFFIARCLTLSLDKNNITNVLSTINSKELNWDEIVKISSKHLLLPTLYSNLKIAKLLKYLPKDLVEYMGKIMELNKKRNYNIIRQANEINNILKVNNITPIFLLKHKIFSFLTNVSSKESRL